jgi:hypothetical protein
MWKLRQCRGSVINIIFYTDETLHPLTKKGEYESEALKK